MTAVVRAAGSVTSEGHAEASRRGWQRSDHGESGMVWRQRRSFRSLSCRGWQRSDHRRQRLVRSDSEGHSEAARRGWWGRGTPPRNVAMMTMSDMSVRSRRDDEYRSRSRHDEDRRYESFRAVLPMMTTTVAPLRAAADMVAGRGDPEGHSEASRRGWENRR